MSSQTTTGTTPAKVAKMATQTNALNTGEMALIGIFGRPDNLAALVREPGGRIRKVKRGQKLGSERILGIDGSGLMLEKGGQTRQLGLLAG